jgi:hypothetical protein
VVTLTWLISGNNLLDYLPPPTIAPQASYEALQAVTLNPLSPVNAEIVESRYQVLTAAGVQFANGEGNADHSVTIGSFQPGSYTAIVSGKYSTGQSWTVRYPFEVVVEWSVTERFKTQELGIDSTTLTSNSYFDFVIDSPQAITGVDATINGEAIAPPSVAQHTGTHWAVRVYFTDFAAVVLTPAFDGGYSDSRRYYVQSNAAVPVGQMVEGVQPGQELAAYSNSVSATLGAAPDKPSDLVSVTMAIYNADTGVHRNSFSLDDDSTKGISKVQAENLSPGNWGIKTVWTFTDPGDNVIEQLLFTVAALPPKAPGQTYLGIHTNPLYVNESLIGTVWTDGSANCIRQWLTVDGVEHERPIIAIVRSLSFPLAALGINTPGSYTLQYHAQYSDRSPAISSSDLITVTVQAIPVAQRLDDALANPTDNTLWNAVIAAPDSTPNQKAIAQDMIALNNEIASRTLGSFQGEAENDRNVYLSELAAGTTALPFGNWRQQQISIFSPIEQQEAKDFIANAPASSVNALLNYFNQQKHPYESLLRLILGGVDGEAEGDFSFIRRNSQSYGGTVPNDVVLADYRRYQTAVQSMSQVIPFELFV